MKDSFTALDFFIREKALNRNVRKHQRMVNIRCLPLHFGDICFCVLNGRASSLLFTPPAIMIPFFQNRTQLKEKKKKHLAFLEEKKKLIPNI